MGPAWVRRGSGARRRGRLWRAARMARAGVPCDTPREFEFEQHELHRRRRSPRLPDDLVHRDRRGTEQPGDGIAVALAGLDRPCHLERSAPRFARHPAVDRPERFKDVIDILDQRRPLTDQLIASLRARVERRAWHRHDLAPEITRAPRRDQRARSRRRFDHHGPVREPGDDAVARREMSRQRFGARRLFGDQQLVIRDLFLQRGIFGRIGNVDPARDDRRGRSAQRTDMRGGIDPARQPAHHGHPADSQIGRQLP